MRNLELQGAKELLNVGLEFVLGFGGKVASVLPGSL